MFAMNCIPRDVDSTWTDGFQLLNGISCTFILAINIDVVCVCRGGGGVFILGGLPQSAHLPTETVLGALDELKIQVYH